MSATVRADPNGRVTILMGTTSRRHSVETTRIQVVAEELGDDLEDMTLIGGDTAGTPTARERKATGTPCPRR